ncbi:MAG: hypothetical protein M1833_004167 [Piccolia ochrophora]|nr:MAG: hypothetical protein M1833_004167 [Piccolia ochrophora]
MARTINILLTSFPGLDLPSTLCLQSPASSTVADLESLIYNRLPPVGPRLLITTSSNKQLSSSSSSISTLFSDKNDVLLPLRLSAPLCGGKGGFGSQLRAAGGRMSSRRKKNNGEDNGSNRNLDGRRLRTVTEAKALAEYLAIKPEMEKKEKEERRKRWEQVVELAEKKEQEIKSGAKGKVDGQWVEDKDEAGERTREAVLAAMKSGQYSDNLLASSSGSSGGGLGVVSESSEEDEAQVGASKTPAGPATKPISASGKTYYGWDEDDEFMSDDDDEEEIEAEDAVGADPKGKGKAKA